MRPISNSFDLSPSSQATLRGNVEQMKAHSTYDVVVFGHCDERGTIEYNLSLGEKRANAVMDYLVGQGVATARLSVISFGKERPADAGHTEAAWDKNRRAEFRIVSQ